MSLGCVGRTASLTATIPVTKHIKDKLDSAGDSQLLEDSVDVVPNGMFLHLKPLSNFAVFQAIGDETDHVFLAAGQQGRSMGIAYMKRLRSEIGL